jgi:hypothetical protein
MPSLKHKFTSLKADGGDATFVRPSNWNDDHDLVSDGASMYLGRDATGSGDVKARPPRRTGWRASKLLCLMHEAASLEWSILVLA